VIILHLKFPRKIEFLGRLVNRKDPEWESPFQFPYHGGSFKAFKENVAFGSFGKKKAIASDFLGNWAVSERKSGA